MEVSHTPPERTRRRDQIDDYRCEDRDHSLASSQSPLSMRARVI
jgi:hypothetical protein